MRNLMNESLLLIAETDLLTSMKAFKPSEKELRDKAEMEEERRYDWNHTDYEPDDICDDDF